jgi:hypothetical protein
MKLDHSYIVGRNIKLHSYVENSMATPQNVKPRI